MNISTHHFSASFDRSASSWSVRFSLKPVLALENLTFSIELNEKKHPLIFKTLGQNGRIEFEPLAGGFRVSLRAGIFSANNRFLCLGMTMANHSKFPLRVGRIHILTADLTNNAGTITAEELRHARMYCHSGGMSLCNVHAFSECEKRVSTSAEGEPVFDVINPSKSTAGVGFTVLHLPSRRRNIIAGFGTVEKSIPCFTARRRKGGFPFEGMYECRGYELTPGTEKILDEFLLGGFADGFEALETYADAVRKRNGITIWPEIPTGWADWVFLGFEKNETDAMATLNVIRKQYRRLGLRYAYVSTSWNKGDMPGDWLDDNRKRYPHGLRWLNGQCKKAGMQLGLWTAPLTVAEGTRTFKNLAGAIIRDADGRLRKFGRWTWLHNPKTYILDWTHPEARRYLARIYRKLRNRGVRWLMVDFTGYWPLDKARYHETSLLPNAESFRYGRRWLQKQIGNDVFVTDSSGPTLIALGLMPGTRVALDCGVGDNLHHLRNIATTIGANYFAHRRWWINDPDYFTGGGGNSLAVDRIRFMLVALSGGVSLIGGDLPHATEDDHQLNRQLFPPFGEAARPVDLFENEHPRLWRLTVEKDWDSWQVWGSFNLTDKPVKNLIRLPEGTGGGDCIVWDFWEKEVTCVTRRDVFIGQKPASGSLFAVRRLRPHPWPVATDMHYTQGGVELENVRWRKETLSGTAWRPAGCSGKIFIHVPAGYDIRNIVIGNKAFHARRCRQYSGLRPVNISILPFHFHGKRIRWKIKFNRKHISTKDVLL